MAIQREIFVLYKAGSGYKMRSGGHTDDFTRARVYAKKNHASLSKSKDEEIIPCTVTVDPENLFSAILKSA